MSYIVQENYVEVVGKGWYGQTMATRYNLDKWKLEDIQERMIDNFPNEAIQDWLDTNSGDFMQIDDFTATLDKFGVAIPWNDEDNEYVYMDMMYPELQENFDN